MRDESPTWISKVCVLFCFRCFLILCRGVATLWYNKDYMSLKNILITLVSIAVVLGLITFYVVFYANTGTYIVNSDGDTSEVFATSTVSSSTLASSSASSSAALATSTAQPYSVSYTTPPITWSEGNEAMAITGAQLAGSQLTLDMQITMGPIAECVPLNVRIVTDENGDLAPPVTPQFTFPDSGTCTGTPGETYSDQQVVFSVDPNAMPLIFNTGGTSNILFEVNTDQAGDLSVELPPTAG